MHSDSFYGLDELDFAIARELEVDGRRSAAALAKILGKSKKVVNRKLNRLLNERMLRVKAIANPPALGYHTLAMILLNVRLPELDTIADKLASYRSVQLVVATAGGHDIVMMVIAHNPAELFTFLRHEVAGISGITRMETMISLETRKLSFSYLAGDTTVVSRDQPYPELDRIDLALIKELERNGRQQITDICKELDISRPTAHKKFGRLLELEVIRIVPLASPDVFGYEAMAFVGINARLSETDAVAQKLAAYPNIHVVLITAGRYKIFTAVWFKDSLELSDFLRIDLGRKLDIENAEVLMFMEVKKLRMSLLS